MKKIIIGLMLLCSTIFAGEIRVAAAANVGYVIEKLVKEFNKTNPDIKVQVTLGSSGKLVSQIEYGAIVTISHLFLIIHFHLLSWCYYV